MERFKVPDFAPVQEWTERFCKSQEWKVRPALLVDDLYQECYIKWEKLWAMYGDVKTPQDIIYMYRASCVRMVQDHADLLRLRRTESTDSENYSEPVRPNHAVDGGSTQNLVLRDFIQFCRTKLSAARESDYEPNEMIVAVRERLSGDESQDTARAVEALVQRIGPGLIRAYFQGD